MQYVQTKLPIGQPTETETKTPQVSKDPLQSFISYESPSWTYHTDNFAGITASIADVVKSSQDLHESYQKVIKREMLERFEHLDRFEKTSIVPTSGFLSQQPGALSQLQPNWFIPIRHAEYSTRLKTWYTRLIDMPEDQRLSECRSFTETISYELLAYFDLAKSASIMRDWSSLQVNLRNLAYSLDRYSLSTLSSKLASHDILSSNTSLITILSNQLMKSTQILETYDTCRTSISSMSFLISIINNPLTNQAYDRACNRIDPRIDDKSKESKDQKSNAKRKYLPVAYSTWTGHRPDDRSITYEAWNGFQAFDLDLKNNATSLAKEQIYDLAHALHNKLSRFKWYMLTKESVSRTGLHIFTKVQAPGYIGGSIADQRAYNRFWFIASYYAKYCEIKTCLLELGLDTSTIDQVLDKSMMKISQGIVLSYSPLVLENDNWHDVPISYEFHECRGIDDERNVQFLFPRKRDKDRVAAGLLKLDDVLVKSDDGRVFTEEDLLNDDSLWNATADSSNYDASKFDTSWAKHGHRALKQIDHSSFLPGDRDKMRYSVINSAVAILGDTIMTDEMLRYLLRVGDVFPEREYSSKYRHAVNAMRVLPYGVSLLQRHGVDIKLNDDVKAVVEASNLEKAVEALSKSNVQVDTHVPDCVIKLEPGEYLSDRLLDLIDTFDKTSVNVIESAPGTGKTHLFSSLARSRRVLLILPYIATLQSKIENSEFSEEFEVLHGSTKYDPESTKSIAMTIDKFSNMEIEELLKFDYIACDESHLLFKSKYRANVVATTLILYNELLEACRESERQQEIIESFSRLYNRTAIDVPSTIKSCPTLIMMTGTITGELLYFDDKRALNYIKVTSKHRHRKDAHIVLTKSDAEKDVVIAHTIASSIRRGDRVIVPTNRGQIRVETILALANEYLDDELKLTEQEVLYYKKDTNVDERSIDITRHKNFGSELRVLFCTNYLSVGVDINSKLAYRIVYDGAEFGYDAIEQFNNRIRTSDIACTIVYSGLTNEGEVSSSMYEQTHTLALPNLESSVYQDILHDDKIVSITNAELTKADYQARAKMPSYFGLNSKYHFGKSRAGLMSYEKLIVSIFEDIHDNFAKTACSVKSALENIFDYNVTVAAFIDGSIDDAIELKKRVAREVSLAMNKRKSSVMLDVSVQLSNLYDNVTERSLSINALRVVSEARLTTNVRIEDYRIYVSHAYIKQAEFALQAFKAIRPKYTHASYLRVLSNSMDAAGIFDFAELRRLKTCVLSATAIKRKATVVAQIDAIVTLNDFLNDVDLKQDNGTYHLDEWQFSRLKTSLFNHAESAFESIAKMGKFKTSEKRIELESKIMEFVRTYLPGRIVKNSFGAEEYRCKLRKIEPFDNASFNHIVAIDDAFTEFFAAGVDGDSVKIIKDFEETRKIRMTSTKQIAQDYVTTAAVSIQKESFQKSNMFLLSTREITEKDYD